MQWKASVKHVIIPVRVKHKFEVYCYGARDRKVIESSP